MKYLLCVLFLIAGSSALAGEFTAGFAKVAITPIAHKDRVETMMAGFKTVETVSDPLYARALILSDGNSRIAMVSLDLIYVPSEILSDFLEELKATEKFDQIFLSITHTHSGYVGDNNYAALQGSISSALKDAEATLQPVNLGAAEGSLDEAYNRIIRKNDKTADMLWTNPERLPNRDVDQAVGVINLQGMDGKTLLNIVNFSAHPVVTMDLHNVVISADYPGELARSLREQGEGETLFFLGAAGDINPYDADTKPTALALEKSRNLGEKLAEEVLMLVRGIDEREAEGQFNFNTLSYELPVTYEPGDVDSVSVEVNTLLLTNKIALASFPGEFFNDFGLRLKTESPVEHTFFLGYTNGSLGYVPTLEAVEYGGYGATVDELWVSVDTGDKQLGDAIKSLQTLHKSRHDVSGE